MIAIGNITSIAPIATYQISRSFNAKTFMIIVFEVVVIKANSEIDKAAYEATIIKSIAIFPQFPNVLYASKE